MKVHIPWLKEDLDKWNYCMYCGQKLLKIENEPVKICPSGHVAIDFIKEGKLTI